MASGPHVIYLGISPGRDQAASCTAPAPGTRYPLDPGRGLYIGRGTTADIRVLSNQVARAHVLLCLMPGVTDRLVVADLCSTNGTWLDGQRSAVAFLAPGQCFDVAGMFRFRFDI